MASQYVLKNIIREGNITLKNIGIVKEPAHFSKKTFAPEIYNFFKTIEKLKLSLRVIQKTSKTETLTWLIFDMSVRTEILTLKLLHKNQWDSEKQKLQGVRNTSAILSITFSFQ